jgi:transaldolase / glucose-6-phosphate isomerase
MPYRSGKHNTTASVYGKDSRKPFRDRGSNSRLFLVLTKDDGEDIEIPEQSFTFGVLMRAQATGDLEVLRNHGQRALRIHVGKDVKQGLGALNTLIREVMPKRS